MQLRAPFAEHTAAEKTQKKQDDADADPAVVEEDDDDGPDEDVIDAAEADDSKDVVNLITSEMTCFH